LVFVRVAFVWVFFPRRNDMLEAIADSEDFLKLCRSLLHGGEYTGKVIQVEIDYVSESKCPIGHKGAYIGSYFNTGVVRHNSYLYYCPLCDKVEIKKWIIDSEDEKTLPFLKSQAVQQSISDIYGYWSSDAELTASPCPECNGKTLLYIENWNPDQISCWECSFLVCVNPNCDWPGKVSKNHLGQV
jgi:hypothetical protein